MGKKRAKGYIQLDEIEMVIYSPESSHYSAFHQSISSSLSSQEPA